MNERILAIESALRLLMTARIESMHAGSSIGHRILAHTGDHLEAELEAMIQDDDRCPCGAGIGEKCKPTCRTQTARLWQVETFRRIK